MKKIYPILGGMALAVLPLGAQAQSAANDSTLNRTVVVEQEYNPDIRDAAKINVLPKVEAPAASGKTVEYDATLSPAKDIPTSVMPAYMGKEKAARTKPGYVRLGYGNYGNLDVRANYLFALSARDRLNLTVRMDGMDGKLDVPGEQEKWRSYFYRTHAGVDYAHAFSKVTLNVAGHFGLSNFNYRPGQADSKQKLLSGDVHLGVKSTDEGLPVQFRAETNLMWYERQHEIGMDNARETLVHTEAEATGSLSDGQAVGIALAMDNVFYGNEAFEDYTALGLNPYYRLKNESWSLRMGAHVDLALGYGKAFRVSPDVEADYTFAESYQIYAQAKGGKLRNDFRRLESLSPYGQVTTQPDATYEQVNAALGFKASPLPGLWFNLYGGYQSLKNDLLQTAEVYPSALLLTTAHTQNVYAGAELRYDYKQVFAFIASGIYRHWSIDEEDTQKHLLRFKPSLEADVRMEARPATAVTAYLGYRHIAREKVDGARVDAASNLYVGGSYEFLQSLSVYVRVNNLLNKDYQYAAGYPTEGLNLVAGISVRF